MGKNKNKKSKNTYTPFVSVCTPTFNRRPFIPYIIKCFENQTYPKDKLEWIIIDDGTDKIEDLVLNIPQVKYFKFDTKMTLGKKRNLSNEKAIGDIIIYMDDDDYYPPERISHAVEILCKHPKILCAGSSKMLIYFKHINKMLEFGPYGPNHATAATFAFKKELLEITSFKEEACVAEEKHFLKNYTIPFVQLDTKKTILVFSHIHNSFDKKELLKQMPNPYIHETILRPEDLIKEPEILNFFIDEIDKLLENYEPGKPEHKKDVSKELKEIQEKREQEILKKTQYLNNVNQNNNPTILQNKINELTYVIQELSLENNNLKDKVTYLENKIKNLIQDKIKERTQNKIQENI